MTHGRTVPLKVAKGTVLFRPEQDCPGFVRLTQGQIKVSLTAPNGREVVLYRVGPGDVCLQTFSCLINRQTYSAEGIAESDISGDIIPPEDFRRRVEEDTEFREQVFAAVARRFADFEQLVEDVALTGFDVRLARALLRLRTPQDEVLATHGDLAAETASGRAFVSRRLGEFAKAGLVEPHRGRLKLLDIAGLEHLAAEER